MVKPNDPKIPEEILRSEQGPDHPARSTAPTVMGLPGLPADIIQPILRYGPVLVLAGAAYGGFGVVNMFIGLSAADNSQVNGQVVVGAMLLLASCIAMALSYIWLVQKRRIGWNTLALALAVQLLGQLAISGIGSILFAGIELLITVYIMLQIRDDFMKD